MIRGLIAATGILSVAAGAATADPRGSAKMSTPAIMDGQQTPAPSGAGMTSPMTEAGEPATAIALPSGADFTATMLRWSSQAAAPRVSGELLELPVQAARLSSRFGIRSDPMNGGMRAHWGIDIPKAAGTPVHAAGSGVVTFAGWSHGYGNLVRIDHGDGHETRYAHLSAITVTPGIALQQGAIVGNVGSTGRSTGAHLHFEVRQNGMPIDPLRQEGLLVAGARTIETPLRPVDAHWDGFGEDRGALPQSRLR